MKPVIIGMTNPHSADPADALGCIERRGTGYRLWKMLNDLTGASEDDYLRTFDRRNLLPGRWSARQSRQAASRMELLPGAEVLLLGEEVRSAFGLPRLLVHPQVVDDVVWRQVPHPSGRCFFYNDPIQRHVVAMVLKDLYLRSSK